MDSEISKKLYSISLPVKLKSLTAGVSTVKKIMLFTVELKTALCRQNSRDLPLSTYLKDLKKTVKENFISVYAVK